MWLEQDHNKKSSRGRLRSGMQSGITPQHLDRPMLACRSAPPILELRQLAQLRGSAEGYSALVTSHAARGFGPTKPMLTFENFFRS